MGTEEEGKELPERGESSRTEVKIFLFAFSIGCKNIKCTETILDFCLHRR
jgi:hypothetical protein